MGEHTGKGLHAARHIATERLNADLSLFLSPAQVLDVAVFSKAIVEGEQREKPPNILDFLTFDVPADNEYYITAVTDLHELINHGTRPPTRAMTTISKSVQREQLKRMVEYKELSDDLDNTTTHQLLVEHFRVKAIMAMNYFDQTGENPYGMPEAACEKLKRWKQLKLPYVADPTQTYSEEQRESLAGRTQEALNIITHDEQFQHANMPNDNYYNNVRETMRKRMESVGREITLLSYCDETLQLMGKAMDMRMPLKVGAGIGLN